VVLSFLGASEFKERIAKLLESPNEYDRSGACFALGELKATEYANQIASLLAKPSDGFYRDESPIDSLVAMGVAPRFKKEIAATLGEDFSAEVNKAAAYALAHLGAREYAPQVSNLLAKRYRRGDAAKALAIMGANEYMSEIAQMLDANDAPLDQCAALLALGILKARDYAPQAARLMRTKRKSFVSNFAAESLVLMGEQKYAAEIISILKVNKTSTYIDTSDFHPLVEPEVHQVNKDFVAMIERFKRTARLRDAARGSR
jgi:HEAT repeat protein